VVDLYREWKTDEWCSYLYENIWVFINCCKTIRVASEDRDDIAAEAILEAHKSISKSLDRSYWQIYSYLKTRIMWRIKNYYLKEHNVIHKYYDIDVDAIDDHIEINIITKVSDATALKFILEWILELSEDERKVIYLRIFNYPGKTLKYISNVSWASKQYLSSKFMTATKKIRKYLELNWIIYEDLF
jgi:hypothetical protein